MFIPRLLAASGKELKEALIARGHLVRCGARPAVNEIRQTDFLFLKPVAVWAAARPPRRNRCRLCVNCTSKWRYTR